MLEELSELLLGLVGAGIALAALYFFIANVQREDTAGAEPEPRVGQHQALGLGDAVAPAPPERPIGSGARPSVAALYLCAEAGAPMERRTQVQAVAGRGLEGDRYFHNRGHWSESDECEVTLIAQEDLDQATAETGIPLGEGRHRRNIVTRDIDPASLIGRRFRVGGAYFGAARPRPPCLYLQQLTEPGLARALVGRGGIGVHCFKSGPIRDGDSIEILNLSLGALLRRRWLSRRTDNERSKSCA